ncbi:cytochrome P450 4C1-like isoform X2 [Neodiprion fabricii]|uniref:cytochrome P450 4C1-like isoform X2 n=1 Tax=Neodiprion fabricii TaxID=2872261 RepID=UPI001ED8E6F6|nr:cytochrome P450 4C1-like isoform X2 [Neodiprion fabricii]
MDPSTVATLAVACFVLYRIINFTIKLFKVALLFEYPLNAEELPSLPFVGHAYLFIGGNEAILNRMNQLGKNYPTWCRVSFGNNPVYLMTSPEHLKEILLSQKTIKRSFFYDFARPLLGDGLMTAPESMWEVHRKLIQPSFNPVVLKSFLKTFATLSVTLAKKMEQHLDGPEFEIYRYVSLCTFDAICVTAMGVNLNAMETAKCEFDEAVSKVMTGFTKRATSPWLYPDFIFYRTQVGKDQTKYIKFIHDFTDNVIRQRKPKIVRRSDQRVSADNEEDSFDTSAARSRILIENLLRLSMENKTLTDEQIRCHIDTTIVGGTDTAAITMNYFLLMLASHQDIQEKIYQELCDIFEENVLEDDNEELHITMDALVKMTYTERVIKETMRLFPGAPIIGRETTDDLKLGQLTVPKGTSVMLNIFGVHRSEKYWPDPLKFDPDRFLPERFATQEPYSYLPFSGGRRNCIGSKYAMIFMKTITATILWKYILTKDKVTPVKDLRLTFDILLRSVDPDTFRIRRRVK